MKKTTTLLSLLALTTLGFAQSPRMVLFEEFTGENCPPCASTNPAIKPFLVAHQNVDMITIKWQSPIPSAPTSLTSLYKQNQAEIDARDSYYSISSAPSMRVDGQDPSIAFGAPSDHAAYIPDTQSSTFANASVISSPFTIAMSRSWDATYANITVTGTLTASQAFTSVGALKFRLVMTEKEIYYTTAPGTNGEKSFEFVARKSFPDLANGTAMASSWVASQTQTFSIVCPVPSYIWDKTQVEFVGFIQDEGNKNVLQAGLAPWQPISNDAKATTILGLTTVICASSVTPQAVILNNGDNAITTMTINPYLGTVAQAPVYFTGNIAAGATTTIALNALTGLTGGAKTFSYNIVQINGGADNNTLNNTKKIPFNVISSYTPAPISQNYSSAIPAFPGTGWILSNVDAGAATSTWQRSTAANAFTATPAGCAKYNFYNNANVGDIDELFMPAVSLSGIADPMLTFDVAKANYPDGADLNDQLLVKISTDCGANWTTLYSKDKTNLPTAPSTTVAFTPTAAQWRSESINLVAYANAPEVLVKFVTINDYGNNLYMDNVNLKSALATGVKVKTEDFAEVSIFPNPAVNETTIKIVTTNNTNNANVIITNNIGQVVYQNSKSLELGLNQISIDTKFFAAGLYNVTVISKDGSITKKLTVTN